MNAIITGHELKYQLLKMFLNNALVLPFTKTACCPEKTAKKACENRYIK